MTLTQYGIKEWLGGGIIALVVALLLGAAAIYLHKPYIWIGVAFVAVAWLALAAFFRDPVRHMPQDLNAFISPADGVIRDIEIIPANNEIPVFKGKDMLRIGIFLSVLDVHVNRAPCKMNVEYKFYKEGKFHDARNPKASKENESMLIAGIGCLSADGFAFPVAVRQVSGAIARRIVCPVSAGRSLEKGEKYGMIKFGSRTELYLPADRGFEAAVKIGDKVYGGTSIIARFVEENK